MLERERGCGRLEAELGSADATLELHWSRAEAALAQHSCTAVSTHRRPKPSKCMSRTMTMTLDGDGDDDAGDDD